MACTAGSAIKPGLEPLQWILPEALCLAVTAIPGWGAWLDVACSTMSPTMVRIDDLCNSPPPVFPEIDPVKLAEQGQLFVWSKNLSDWVWAAWVNANWAVLCQCNEVTGPGPCPPVAPWGGTVTGSQFAPLESLGERAIGHDWTTMNGVLHCPSSNAYQIRGTFRLKDASHAFLRDVVGLAAVGTDAGITFNNSVTTAADRTNVRFLEFLAVTSSGTTAPPQATTFEITGYTGACSQDTTTIPSPPAPHDPGPGPTEPPPPPLDPASCTTDDLCRVLYEVLLELKHTGQLVTLLQRYGLPFNYVRGPQHVGLSGSGSFPIAGLAGVQVDLTANIPGRALEGTPPYLWDAGWMSIMTGDGMIEEKRITRDTQVWQPRLIQEASTFGYFFKDATVATITELQPEAY